MVRNLITENGTPQGRLFEPLVILIKIKYIFDQIPRHIGKSAFAVREEEVCRLFKSSCKKQLSRYKYGLLHEDFSSP